MASRGVSQYAIDPADAERMRAARAGQDYESEPPRCFNCVYFKRARLHGQRLKKTRKGVQRDVDWCKFGNFPVNTRAICAEWRSHSGETLEEPTNDN